MEYCILGERPYTQVAENVNWIDWQLIWDSQGPLSRIGNSLITGNLW